METQLVQEIIECLPEERTLFHYYRDRYATYLLQNHLRQRGAQKVSQLRNGSMGRLLNKPIFKTVLANTGSGFLNADDLETLWPLNPLTYTLTLGHWGDNRGYRRDQTSRPGTNLVLQMNFCRKHDTAFKQQIDMEEDWFSFSGHPICERGRTTLAWARIDLDMDRGEALIEEIQTDWLREIRYLFHRSQLAVEDKQKSFYFYGEQLEVDNVLSYYREHIEPHTDIWGEAMLTAALWFIHQELGIKTIYYHSFQTGNVLKNLRWSQPPRSLYTELPRKFCFDIDHRGPAFIVENKSARRRLKAIKNPQWFRMVA